MLLKIVRGVIFLHDTFMFINIYSSSILRELPLLYSPLSTTDKQKRTPSIEVLVMMPYENKELAEVFKEKFHERIERIKEEKIDPSRVVDVIHKNAVKIYPSMEYGFRGFPWEILALLARYNYLWVIPYKDITRVNKYRDLMEITYYSFLLGTRRTVRLRYDEELYNIIHSLCIFNNNQNCYGGIE